VWIEGGLAPARTFRTVFGARRGYATLAIDFPQPGYRSTGNYPINLMMTVDENPRQSPIYHGAVALLKAVSFLESRKQVDADRIGMAGSSWGGFYTTLMVGVDPRLKVGSCMFGGGNLQMGNMWWDAYNRSERFAPIFRDHWRKTLDPAWRLPRRDTPLAWFTGTNDWFFWIPSVMKTYDMAGGPKHLSLVPNWDHALPASVTEQTFIWLDAHLKERPDFIEVTPVEVEKRGSSLWAQWRYSAPRDPRRQAKEANLILSWGDAGNWHARYWKTLPARMQNGICEVRLPDGDMPFYISGSVVDEKEFVSSTPLQRVEPRRFQIEYSYTPLNYDGCSDWGNFEIEQLPYLKRHKWSPRLTRNAAIGEHAVVLEAGETRLPMLHFTQGVPHRFTCWMRIAAETATAPTAQVVVQFNAGFNGKAQPDGHRVVIGTEWTPVELEVTPHEDLTQRHNASILVPDGVELLLDRVRFRPLPDPWSDSDPLPQNNRSGIQLVKNLKRRSDVSRPPLQTSSSPESHSHPRLVTGFSMARRLP
jgi:pimeloyl-ACP methyl ester carboxylesterase